MATLVLLMLATPGVDALSELDISLDSRPGHGVYDGGPINFQVELSVSTGEEAMCTYHLVTGGDSINGGERITVSSRDDSVKCPSEGNRVVNLKWSVSNPQDNKMGYSIFVRVSCTGDTVAVCTEPSPNKTATDTFGLDGNPPVIKLRASSIMDQTSGESNDFDTLDTGNPSRVGSGLFDIHVELVEPLPKSLKIKDCNDNEIGSSDTDTLTKTGIALSTFKDVAETDQGHFGFSVEAKDYVHTATTIDFCGDSGSDAAVPYDDRPPRLSQVSGGQLDTGGNPIVEDGTSKFTLDARGDFDALDTHLSLLELDVTDVTQVGTGPEDTAADADNSSSLSLGLTSQSTFPTDAYKLVLTATDKVENAASLQRTLIVDRAPPEVGSDAAALAPASDTAPWDPVERVSLANGDGFAGAGDLQVKFKRPDQFLQTAVLKVGTGCSSSELSFTRTLSPQAEEPSKGQDAAFPSFSASDLGIDPSTPGQDVYFQIEYTDIVGGPDRTKVSPAPSQGANGGDCFLFTLDRTAPEFTSLSFPETVHLTGANKHVLEKGTDFTLDEQHHDTLSVTPTDDSGNTLDPRKGTSKVVLATDDPAEFPTGVYDLQLAATDKAGNSEQASRNGDATIQTVVLDHDQPRLKRVEFDTSDCQPKVFSDGGEPFGESPTPYCPGPYDVEIWVREHNPHLDSNGEPEPPQITNSKFDLSNPTYLSSSTDVLHKWRYTDVQILQDAVAPFTFELDLEEVPELGRSLDETGPIGFRLAGSPKVTFQPTGSDAVRVSSPTTFSLLRAVPTDGSAWPADDCTLPQDLEGHDGAFCIPGDDGSLDIEEVALYDTSGTNGGQVAVLSDSDGDNVYKADVTPGDISSAPGVFDLQARVSTAEHQTGDSSTVILDVSSNPDRPAVNAMTLHKWDPSAQEWVTSSQGSNDIDMPTEGPYLVKLDYTSYSAERIVFEFDRPQDSGQDPITYTFKVAQPGQAGAGVEHDPTLGAEQVEVVRATNAVPGISGLTNGCDTASGTYERALWGTDRACYFLLKMDNPGPGSGSFSDGQDYRVKATVNDARGQASVSQSEAFTPSSLTTSLDDVTLDPEPPQVGLETTLEVDISDNDASDSEMDEIRTWVCLIRPISEDDPSPAFDPAYDEFSDFQAGAGPDCRPTEHPIPGTGEVQSVVVPAVPTGDGNDPGPVRQLNFTISSLQSEGGELEDSFYLRLIVRDRFGNLRAVNHHDQDPNVFDVAQFSPDARLLTVSSNDTATFKDETRRGCFQAESSGSTTPGNTADNSEENPCVKRLDLAPKEDGGGYGPIDIPVILLNDGNVEDEFKVTWGHQGGRAAWDVTLVDPETNTETEKPMSVTLPEPTGPNQPSEKEIIVRLTPDSSSRGGDFRMINLTAESKTSATPLEDRRQIYLRGSLVPVRRGALTLNGTGSPVGSMSVTPDTTEFMPVQLANTGNTRETFVLQAASDSDSVCQFGGTTAPNMITIDLESPGGNDLTTTGRELLPAQSEELRFRVEVGQQVSTSPEGDPYACSFEFKDTSSGDEILRSTPELPTLNIAVTGASDIQLFELRGHGDDRELVEVTGEEIVHTVPPTKRFHSVTLFMENNGTIPLDPELRTPVPVLEDELGLGGQWLGANKEDPGAVSDTISIDQASQPFGLTVSDTDDPTELVDHVDAEGRPPSSGSSGDDWEDAGPWRCLAKDDQTVETDDEDPRYVCWVELRYRVPTGPSGQPQAVTGDEVLSRLAWDDPSDDAKPARVDVRLAFGHVGTVETTSVQDHVMGQGETNVLRFNASLAEDRAFALDQTPVTSTAHFGFDGTACGSAAGPDSTAIGQDRSWATFRVRLTLDSVSDGACSVTLSGDTYEVSTSGPGRLSVRLAVEDANGTQLRTIAPAQVDLQSAQTTDPQPAQQLAIRPNETLQANGTQSFRFLFDDRSPDASTLQGVALTRKTTHEITPYVDCGLDGTAASLAGTGGLGRADDQSYRWVSASPAAAPADSSTGRDSYAIEENATHVWLNDENGNRTASGSIAGQILTRERVDNEERAVHVGDVSLVGWGTSDGQVAFREGWNPLVFYIEDTQGEPALPADHSSGVTARLTLAVLYEDASGQLHRYQLAGETRGVKLDSLGGGFYSYDLHLPAGFADLDPNGFSDLPTDERTSSRIANAWTMRLEVDGTSRGGRDMTGDAVWQIDDAASGIQRLKTTDADARSTMTTPVDEGTRTNQQRTLHTALRLMGGPIGSEDDWVTGPGVHQVGAYLQEETLEQARDLTRGGRTLSDVRDHTFDAVGDSDLRLSYQALPGGRVSAAADAARLTPVDGQDGLFRGVLFLPDTGQDSQLWVTQFQVRDTSTSPPRNLVTDPDRLVADARAEPPTNGIPMPMCIEGNLATGDVPLFEEESLGSQTTLDVRAVPGLTPDRGPFSLTPVLTSGDDGNGGILHDAGADVFVQGEGLADLRSIELPSEAEVDVPISLSATVVGPVLEVRATLSNSTGVVDETTLAPDDDGTYRGSVTASQIGTHQLVLLAEDVASGVDTEEATVEVVENALPRISVTSPVPVDGTRAIRPNGTITAEVTDRSLAGAAVEAGDEIRVERSTGSQDGDGGADGQAFDPVDNITVTDLVDEVETGSHAMTVSVENDTIADTPSDWRIWVNVTDSDDALVDDWNASLDSEATASDSIALDAAGTYTVNVKARNTSVHDAPRYEADFTVTVVEPATGGFQNAPTSTYSVACEATTCEVDWQPDNVQDGDSVVFRVVAEITPEDTATGNETTVAIDDTPPSASVTVETPSTATPPAASPGTLVTVEASDETGIDQLRVSGVRGGTTSATTTVSGDSGEVSLSELGLEEEGTATINLTAIDIAGNQDTTAQRVEIDASGPSVTSPEATVSGTELTLEAGVTDPAGVDQATLFYQRPGEDRYTSSVMTSTGDGDTYTTTVSEPGDAGTLRFYIQARDRLGNQAELGTQGNPRTLDLGEVPEGTNAAPEVSILSPSEGDHVAGTITISWQVTDPDGDDVTVDTVGVEPVSGDAVSPSIADGEATLNTSELPEGQATITVEASDGQATGTGEVTVVVDNLPAAGSCEEDTPLEAGDDVTVCFELETGEAVEEVEAQLMQNGDVLSTTTLEPNPEGSYEATFDIPEEGTYSLKMIKHNEDGSTEETVSEPFSVQSFAGVDRPTSQFLAVLVMGVAVIGLATYAAFGRWS